MRALLAAAFLLSAATGCASLESVSMTQVPKERGTPVSAQSSSWGFLGIFFSNSFADEAVDELRRQCPTGKLMGVFTKHENRFYLLVLERRVNVTGMCVASSGGGKGA